MLPYPETRATDVVDILHGETIADPYRWLEEGDTPETRRWTEAQNALTQAHLAAAPGRDRIRRRLEELLAIGVLSVPTPVRGRYFYLRREGRQNQPVLYWREGVEGADRVAVDPNTLNEAGTTALDWYQPSEDGRLLAYGISENGSEESVLHLLQPDTGRHLPERISRMRAASLAWLPDGRGFYYTRYPAPGTVPPGEEQYHRAIYFHALGGDPECDPLVFKPAEKEHWPEVKLSPDGRWLLVHVARTFDQTDLYVRDLVSGGDLVAVARDLPALFDGEIAHGQLFLRTNLDAPTYRLYLVDPESPERSTWREIVHPRGDAVLEGAAVTQGRLALSYLERASSRLRLVDFDGRVVQEVALPTLGSLFGVGTEWNGNELFYGFSSYTVPPSVYRIDLVTGETSLWRQVDADLDPGRFEVRQVSYQSRDGTPVSMFLVHRTGVGQNRPNPTYLTGYGGFNISMTPSFSRSLLLWLEHGGIVAIPNIRGGGEYGETWHQAGILGSKQNSFDDFIGAAEWLIREGYTTPERLAAAGGSNGGLLVGAVLTQRPELFRAVLVQVPLLDMLRYHRFLIARLWIPEYGSADDPEQYRWLRAYSPYHHVRQGVAYPAVLLATAESDTRVDPMHARKMAARLQAATSTDRPILLRLESRAGHGAGKPLSKVLDELTDSWTFVFSELGVEV
ncbi:MAG TPA: prolyl oligopeptidase family serine peptidase [Gemmatimonadales bacterium]|nr:prolyl oligopeptidase family serine peptidase [Gemmatimonadales bacterium]